MKILIVCDVKGWAIDQLAQAKIRYNPHHIWKCEYIHPRDAGNKVIQEKFLQSVEDFKPDVIHFEYFRSCSQLLEALPKLKKYKIVLTHHNQRTKALRHKDWVKLGVDYLVTHTKKCKQLLVEDYNQPVDKVSVINHGINLDYFRYNDEEPKEKRIGYAGRIVPWKGLKEIAEVGNELNYPVLFMGRRDKPEYFASISEEARANIDFSFMECKDGERLDYYRNLTCYVGFSDDNKEEGTLELLEAMASGVPVITTLSGVARDIAKDRENCLVTPFEDKEALKDAVQELMGDEKLRQKLRKNAWNTVKSFTQSRMARRYDLLYNEVKNNDRLVSVIIPTTFDRIEYVERILKSLSEQDYKGIEAVVVFDEDEQFMKKYMLESKRLRDLFPLITIKTEWTAKDGYNLAMARNLGAIQSSGEILVFCDSRLLPQKDSILLFKNIFNSFTPGHKVWLFGNKGANKKTFVENFSAILRKNFFIFGMFNERITDYGGMSQEIRTRWIKQGGSFEYIEDAMAEEMITSKNSSKKKQSIIQMKDLLFRIFGGNNH